MLAVHHTFKGRKSNLPTASSPMFIPMSAIA